MLKKEMTPELKMQLETELAELTEKYKFRGRWKRNATDFIRDRISSLESVLKAEAARIEADAPEPDEDAPELAPEHALRVGDVFMNQDRNGVVLVAEFEKHSFWVSYTRQLGMARGAGWEVLRKAAKIISKTTCQHHVTHRSWEFIENIEDRWRPSNK